ncbi:sensor domain-containing protein [Paenibacillus radicis (ex Gao et al. 2016)]|uniref:Luciferase n=1 Tax=Paenibacillus radicis (ex Gao et al. 2016) TaxID=1737354 RepID=A0A917H9G2_9BACL|nr:sensor domain-containing protein [Paenibacillus radicis (ex Gao et al. 2016)]GGG71874.1 luciferase [Paenibacillus radicis (ex Gao et al. 2016)]
MAKKVVSYFQNGYFLLLTFVTGLFYFSFYLVALTLGLSLSFTVAGVPLLTHVLRTTTAFLQFERVQTKIYTDITTEPCVKSVTPDVSNWLQAKKELMNQRNWIAIGWLLLKFPVGILCLMSVALLYAVPLVLVAIPFLYPFLNLSFISASVDTAAKAVTLSATGVILLMVSYKLANRLVRLIGGYTRLMIKQVNR